MGIPDVSNSFIYLLSAAKPWVIAQAPSNTTTKPITPRASTLPPTLLGLICTASSTSPNNASNLFAIWPTAKFSCTLSLPALLISPLSFSERPYSALSITPVHSSTLSGSLNHPVTPSTTVSLGPPLSAASTGTPANIASSGTMPKCSLEGVYTSRLADRSKDCFNVLGTERRNMTSISDGTLSAVIRVVVEAFLSDKESARATRSRW